MDSQVRLICGLRQARLRQARKMKTELHIEKQKRTMAETALIEAETRLDTLADALEEQQVILENMHD